MWRIAASRWSEPICAFWAFTLWRNSSTLSFVLAMLVTGLLGVALSLGVLMRVLKGSLSVNRVEAYSLLVFFGISIVWKSCRLSFTGTPRGYDFGNRIVHFLDISVTEGRLMALLAAVLAIAAVIAFFRLTVGGWRCGR